MQRPGGRLCGCGIAGNGLTVPRRMDEVKPDPTFEVRHLKSAPGYYVRVSWRYGQVEHISGFASGEDAQRWVEEKSRAWLRGRKGVSSDN